MDLSFWMLQEFIYETCLGYQFLIFKLKNHLKGFCRNVVNLYFYNTLT